MPCGLRDFEAPRISRQGCQPYAQTAFGPQEILLEAESDPGPYYWPEG
jgi:hypothetical protein